jgi:hypothetical protein
MTRLWREDKGQIANDRVPLSRDKETSRSEFCHLDCALVIAPKARREPRPTGTSSYRAPVPDSILICPLSFVICHGIRASGSNAYVAQAVQSC